MFWSTNFTQDLDHMFKPFIIGAENNLMSLEEHFSKEFIVNFGFFEVVLQWEQLEPAWDDGCSIDIGFLVLDDLAEGSDCVVSGVVELGLLVFLLFRSIVHWVSNRLLQRLKANLALCGEGLTSMLANHTNTVD